MAAELKNAARPQGTPRFWRLTTSTGAAAVVFTNQTNEFVWVISAKSSAGTLNLWTPSGVVASPDLNTSGGRVLIPPSFALHISALSTTIEAVGIIGTLEDLRGYTG